jgi:hypothetical protein
MAFLEGSGVPVLYTGRTVPKGINYQYLYDPYRCATTLQNPSGGYNSFLNFLNFNYNCFSDLFNSVIATF